MSLETIAPYVIGAALLAVVGVLLFGVVSMAIGGEFDKKWSNKLMRLRVALQALAIVLLLALWLLVQG